MGNQNKSFFTNWIKENISKILLGLAIVLIGISFYILNVLYPINLDDWNYSFNLSGGKRIDSFLAILQSQYAHYFEWGGRSVVHSIAQALLWFGETWGNILNTLAYVGLVLLIYFIANKGNKPNVILFLCINIFIWFVLPSVSQNLLWITGSANYLWGCLIVFAFAYPFVSYYITHQKKKGNARNICFLLVGVIAGWTNENVVVALAFIILGIIVLLKIQKIPVPRWMIFGIIGVIIGFAFMIMAPGNFNRNKVELMAVHNISKITPSFYFYRFVTILKLSYVYLLAPVVLYFFFLILHQWKGKTNRKKETLSLSILFFFSSIIATIVMSGSPIFPERAWFGIMILMITATGILYANTDFSSLVMRIANYSVFTVLLGLYIVSFVENRSELERFNETYERRQVLIEEEKRKGERNIIITDTLFEEQKSKLMVLDLRDWLIIDRSSDWAGRLGKYNGVETIMIYDSTEEQ